MLNRQILAVVIQAGVIIASILGGGWVLLEFNIGNIREDISALRTEVVDLRGRDSDGHKRDSELERRILADILEMKTAILGMQSSQEKMALSMEAFQKDLTGRMYAIEQRLSPTAPANFTKAAVEDLVGQLQGAGVDGGKIVVVPLNPFAPANGKVP